MLAVGALVLTGCGGSSSEAPTLKVSAAASLKTAFTAYGEQVKNAEPSFSFAGSDALATQIAQGVKPDVFAAANTKLPDRLFEKGLVEKPTVFAANRLVLAVPADGEVASLGQLARPGTKLAVGQEDVPIGSYTAGIVGKLTQGAVDAGFLYASDVRATEGLLKAIELPAAVQPQVAYGVAVVKGTKHPAEANAFVDGLLRSAGAPALKDAGFEPPPTG